MTLEQLTTFFAWNSAINIGLLLLATLFLTVMRDWVMGIHSSMTGVDKADLPKLYFQYLAGYKLLVLVFCVVPYIVLRVMV